MYLGRFLKQFPLLHPLNYRYAEKMNKRILLLIPTTSYRTRAFMAAAEELGVSVTVCSEEPGTLEMFNPEGFLTADFSDVNRFTKTVFEFSKKYPIDGVIGVDDQTVVAAAHAAEALSLKHNSVDSVQLTRNKYEMRSRLGEQIYNPLFDLFSFDDSPQMIASSIGFPCVIKPLSMSGSLGVMRADNVDDLKIKMGRLKAILPDPHFLVEAFVPGNEIAVEGLVSGGKFSRLAIFDKPDPLWGPYFEETVYVTPTNLALTVQDEVSETASDIVSCLGLTEGPIHLEFRLNQRGIYLVEIAARSIGGFCSDILRFIRHPERSEGSPPISIEGLILRQKLGLETESYIREEEARGVMMIPVPKQGIFREIKGLEEAKKISGIENILISAKEGERYLGFIFAHGEMSGDVWSALRGAYSKLEVVIAT